MTSHLRRGCILILITSVSACSRARDYEGPQRAPVSGRVTLDDRPLPGAAVSFVPIDPAHRRAMGFVGVDGTYSITEGQGPHVGKYKVVLNWPEPPASPEDPPGPEQLPARYNTETTLEVEIVPDGNTHDFDLTIR